MDGSRIQAVAEAAPSGQLTVTVAAGLPVVVAAMGGSERRQAMPLGPLPLGAGDGVGDSVGAQLQ